MKRNLLHTLAAVVAAAAMIGCSADNDIDTPRPDDGMTLTLRTDGIIGDTRTEFDPAINQIKWSASDNAVFYSNGIGRISQIEIGADNIAQFQLSGMRPDGTTRTIQGFYPVEARWSDGHVRNENNQIQAFALTLKSRQEAPSTSFDPEADILIADNLYDVEVSATEKNIVDVRFGRPVAVSQIKYVISNSELVGSDEKVRSITFHVDSPNTTKYLAGNFYFNPETFRYVDVDGNELNTDNSEFFDSARASSVQVMLSDTPAVNADFSAWIVTAPIVLSSGDVVTFTIRTTAGTVITKQVEMSREVAFKNTRRNQLTVNIDDTATVKAGEADAIADGYYVIATDDSMMTSDVIGSALGYTALPNTWVGEGENRKLSISEDKAVWYISQNANGTYNISSKLNGQFINCTAAKSCYLKDAATELKIQTAGGEKYNISVNSTAGRVLGFNSSSPRFAFYDNNASMTNDLQIIPVYIDNMPDFKLLKNEIAVAAAGTYTENDVYQLRNASEKNVLVDVDGTVVTSASIANAAVTFTVAEEGESGWIDLDFNGTAYRIAVAISGNSGAAATLNYADIQDKLSNGYSEGSNDEGWSWKAAKNNNGIQINSTKGYIKIPDMGSAITSVKVTTSTTYKSGYKLYLNTTATTTNPTMTITSGGESYFEFDLTTLDTTYNSLYIISGNAMYIKTVEVTYAN